MSKQCSDVGVFGGVVEHAQKPKFGDRFFSENKKLHTTIRSVQFLASFISFYFEILSYLICGENIIRLASTNSVKLDEKSTSISSLSDMLQEALFLLTCYIYFSFLILKLFKYVMFVLIFLFRYIKFYLL